MRIHTTAAALALGALAPLAEAAERRYVIDAKASSAAYQVEEVFLGINPRDFSAMGRTSSVSGHVDFDAQRPAASKVGPIQVDLSLLESDDRRRDNQIRNRWLESARFPLAKFTATRVTGLPEKYAAGDPLNLKITGNLTIRDVTKPVTFDATVRVNGDVLTGRATANILMTDFGFDPPSILGFVRAENAVKITLDLTARAAR